MRNKRAIETGGSILTNPDRLHLDDESREILAQFDLEYKALKNSVGNSDTVGPSGLARALISPEKEPRVVTEEIDLNDDNSV